METVPNTTDKSEPAPIGWRVGESDGSVWIGLVRRPADADAKVVGIYHLDEYPTSPLMALGYALDDAVMYVGDPADPAQSIDPIPAEILAALGQPLYTGRLDLTAADVLNPASGPKWQILHGGDEQTWCDVAEVVACAKRDACEVFRRYGDCVVLVSSAWADGYAHMPLDELVSVRIPAASA